MMLEIEPLLFLLVVGQHVLALSVGVIATAVLILVVVDGRRYGAGVGRVLIGTISRVDIRRVIGVCVVLVPGSCKRLCDSHVSSMFARFP